MEMLQESAYVFRDRELMSPQVNEFFRSLEFKSLMTEEVAELKSFGSLGIDPVAVEDAAALETLWSELLRQKSCSVATVAHENRLTGMAVGTGGKYYQLDFAKYSGKEFLERLIGSDLEINGYDIKEELRLMRGYLKNSSQLGEEQIGLIF
jgi:hypothetical protein